MRSVNNNEDTIFIINHKKANTINISLCSGRAGWLEFTYSHSNTETSEGTRVCIWNVFKFTHIPIESNVMRLGTEQGNVETTM